MMLKLAATSFREVLKTTWLLQIGRAESVQNDFLEAEPCMGLSKNLSSWFEKVSSEVSVAVTAPLGLLVVCCLSAGRGLPVQTPTEKDPWRPLYSQQACPEGECGGPTTPGCRKPALLCSLLVFFN